MTPLPSLKIPKITSMHTFNLCASTSAWQVTICHPQLVGGLKDCRSRPAASNLRRFTPKLARIAPSLKRKLQDSAEILDSCIQPSARCGVDRISHIASGHIHGLLRDRIARSSLANDLPPNGEIDSEELYGRLYFDLGALAIDELGERFDAVLIDETQDFDASRIADIARARTEGVAELKIILFGDFTRQALHGRGSGSLHDLRNAFSSAPVFNLKINCRNTKRITTYTDLLCGFTGTRISEKQAEGDPVQVFYAASQADGVAKLGQIVAALRSAGVRPADVAKFGLMRHEGQLIGGLVLQVQIADRI
jgi:hypothetical protein